MKEAFTKIKEAIANIHRVVKTDEDLEWNRAIYKCSTIVSEVEAEYGKKGCALCYLGSPCEYQNEDVRIPDELMGWIPCSERLPEDFQSVLCYAESLARRPDTMFIGSQKHGCWFLQSSIGTESFPTQYEVLAWMPLPEPYKPEK